MIGKLTEISRSFTGKLRATFEVDAVDELRGLEDKELSITVKPHREKRSLSANAYFHVLVGKLADRLHISKPKMKNILLGRYGQREILQDKPLIISAVSTVDLYEREDIHCIPVGYAKLQGKDFTHWAVIRPSHTYDSAEMSSLIDGTVSEAKDQGIETLTPRQLQEMMESWNRYCKKEKSASSAEPQADWTNIM